MGYGSISYDTCVLINTNIGTAHIKASTISLKFKLEQPEISSETISI